MKLYYKNIMNEWLIKYHELKQEIIVRTMYVQDKSPGGSLLLYSSVITRPIKKIKAENSLSKWEKN